MLPAASVRVRLAGPDRTSRPGAPLNPFLIAVPAAVAFGVLQASVFEWLYHRYWLHRPWLPPQMFTAHTLVHHQLCKHDDTYHVHDEEQEEALTFQWWGGPVLVAINLLPWLALWPLLAPLAGGALYGTVLASIGGTIFLYYLAYEGFHYLMHKPTIGWIERSRMFRAMDRHHRLHHAYMGTNFNVVLPLADLLLGTLLRSDPTPGQVTGPGARKVARRHSKYGQRLREREAPRASAPPAPTSPAAEREPGEVTSGV